MDRTMAPQHTCILCILIFSFTVSSLNGLNITANNDYTFGHDESFIELRPRWKLTDEREVSFRFRTLLTHALLMYDSIISNVSNVLSYDMSVQVENAQLVIMHSLLNQSLRIGRALNKDEWHTVKVSLSPVKGNLVVTLDGQDQSQELAPMPLITADEELESVLYFGGLNLQNSLQHRQFSYTRFKGCLGHIELSVVGISFDDLKATDSSEVSDGCINKCDHDDYCVSKSRCINYYSHTTCDCFGTRHEGRVCSSYDISTITLRGYSYVSYKIYDWDDKVHSDSNHISVTFNTMFDNSVLFYAMGEHPETYVSASIIDNRVHFVVNLGDGELSAVVGQDVTNTWWRTFIMRQNGRHFNLQLGYHKAELHVTGENYYMHLDPTFYIGGVPHLGSKPGLKTRNYFVGSLREVYFNSVSILERLKKEDPLVTYNGDFEPEFRHQKVDLMPLTFPFNDSMIYVMRQTTATLDFAADFKTNLGNANIASGYIIGGGHWELVLENSSAKFIVTMSNGTVFDISAGEKLANELWKTVAIKYTNGNVQIVINYRITQEATFPDGIQFSPNITIAGTNFEPKWGFVGCMRDIMIDNRMVDPRPILNLQQYHGQVTMDDCRLIDPCKKPGQCEHGGKCYTMNQITMCNCSGTGYIGKTCHFSLFRRSCEELFLVGVREPGVYMIDIDGNGKHPPVPVRCEIDSETKLITTIVEHNMKREMLVRAADVDSFRLEIKYREFNSEMLQTLIEHSKSCSQQLKYRCHYAPLGLKSVTWFKSSYNPDTLLASMGSSMHQYCPCGETKTCVNETLRCNCDANDGAEFRVDEASLDNPKFLGITDMYFLKPQDVPQDASGYISLGPLKCIEMDTQHYMVTFRTSKSYLKVPGWRVGDLAFSFRTSSQRAILLYQSLPEKNSYFHVLLLNENVMSFEYTVDGKPCTMNISSQTPLNNGEWQQVWVDYDKHHVRFTINMDYQMINLTNEEQFGPFDGQLYIGGKPSTFHDGSPVEEGFVGCFRGLVINDEIVNLHYYLNLRTKDVVQGCKPSCDPNPCFNGAICHEYWGSYSCQCRNTYAHSGIHCENNLNNNGITFIDGKETFRKLFENATTAPAFLTQDILLSIRTYAEKGLILYAHDNVNNFIQLHIENKDELVFTFNSRRELVRGVLKFRELTRGLPIQIFIDRENEYTCLHANERVENISHPLALVDKYRQDPWTEDKELEKVKPPRPPVEPSSYLQYYLGGVNADDNMETSIKGFVGCITGLKVGSMIMDLKQKMDQDPGSEGVRNGCNMTCDTNPCENNGYCTEVWRSRQRICDCTNTSSYFGKSCNEDKGSHFDSRTFVKFPFHAKSTYDKVKVWLAFSTEALFERPMILFFVNSRVDERNYIYIALLPDGRLRFEEDDGSGEIINCVVDTPSGNFADGHRHWVKYYRVGGVADIYIDGSLRSVNITDTGKSQDSITFDGEEKDVVMVGGIDFKDSPFAEFINFSGCLSNVMVEVDDFNIYPLETAFDERPGGQKMQIVGSIKKSTCAQSMKYSPDITTPPPGNPTWYSGPPWKPPNVKRIPFTVTQVSSQNEWSITEANARRVALVMGSFLLVLIIAIGIYLWRLDWKDKQFRYEAYDTTDNPSLQNKKPNFPQNPRGVNVTNLYERPDHVNSHDAREMVPLRQTNMLSNNSHLSQEPSYVSLKSPSLELSWEPYFDNSKTGTTDLMMGSLDTIKEMSTRTNARAPIGTASEVTLSQ